MLILETARGWCAERDVMFEGGRCLRVAADGYASFIRRYADLARYLKNEPYRLWSCQARSSLIAVLR